MILHFAIANWLVTCLCIQFGYTLTYKCFFASARVFYYHAFDVVSNLGRIFRMSRWKLAALKTHFSNLANPVNWLKRKLTHARRTNQRSCEIEKCSFNSFWWGHKLATSTINSFLCLCFWIYTVGAHCIYFTMFLWIP